MNGQGTAQNRYLPGNRIALLRDGAEYFPALVSAIETAQREIWLESYIFADDSAGRLIAAALSRAARRGVHVRLLVDGWGAKLYLTAPTGCGACTESSATSTAGSPSSAASTSSTT